MSHNKELWCHIDCELTFRVYSSVIILNIMHRKQLNILKLWIKSLPNLFKSLKVRSISWWKSIETNDSDQVISMCKFRNFELYLAYLLLFFTKHVNVTLNKWQRFEVMHRLINRVRTYLIVFLRYQRCEDHIEQMTKAEIKHKLMNRVRTV